MSTTNTTNNIPIITLSIPEFDVDVAEGDGWVDVSFSSDLMNLEGGVSFLTGSNDPYEKMLDILDQILNLCDLDPNENPDAETIIDVQDYDKFGPYEVSGLFLEAFNHGDNEISASFQATEEKNMVKMHVSVGMFPMGISIEGFVTDENIASLINDLDRRSNPLF